MTGWAEDRREAPVGCLPEDPGSDRWLPRAGLSAQLGWAAHHRSQTRRRLDVARFAALVEAVFTPWDEVTLLRGYVTRPSTQIPGRYYFLMLGHVMFFDGDGSVERLCIHSDERYAGSVEEMVAAVLAIEANERSFLRRANLEPPPTPPFMTGHVSYEWALFELLMNRVRAASHLDVARQLNALIRVEDAFANAPSYGDRIEQC